MSLSRCIEQNQWYRVFTSVFVHRNPMHLLVNVLALWGCLARVECVYGSWFVFRFSVLIVAMETMVTFLWIRVAVEVYRKRQVVENFFSRLYACLSCREPIVDLRDINVRASFETLRIRLCAHFCSEDNVVSSQSHLSTEQVRPPIGESMAHEGDRHPFSLVRSHPLTLEPVCGIGNLCLAWLAFAVAQASTGASLMPVADAGKIALTQNYLHTRTDGTVQDSNAEGPDAMMMAKYALANTGYPIFGLFSLDPSLAPLIFLLVTRFVAPITVSDQDGAVGLLVQTTSTMRYLMQNVNGFLLGLFLGADVLTVFLPTVYWTLCFFVNCTVLGLNSLASNSANVIRRALAVEETDTESLLFSRHMPDAGNNILGLNFNPEMFDCPSTDLIFRPIDAPAMIADEVSPLDLEEANTGFFDSRHDEGSFRIHGVGMVQRIRGSGAADL